MSVILHAAMSTASEAINFIRDRYSNDKLLDTIPIPPRLTYFLENGEIQNLSELYANGCCAFCDAQSNERG